MNHPHKNQYINIPRQLASKITICIVILPLHIAIIINSTLIRGIVVHNGIVAPKWCEGLKLWAHHMFVLDLTGIMYLRPMPTIYLDYDGTQLPDFPIQQDLSPSLEIFFYCSAKSVATAGRAPGVEEISQVPEGDSALEGIPQILFF